MEPTSMETIKVSFFPFKRSCPLCGDYLDCITHVHAQKHGMTRHDFIAMFIKETVPLQLVELSAAEENETVQDYVVRILSTSPSLWVDPLLVSRKLGCTMQYVRSKLTYLESIGLLQSTIQRIERVAPGMGVPKSYLRKFFALSGADTPKNDMRKPRKLASKRTKRTKTSKATETNEEETTNAKD